MRDVNDYARSMSIDEDSLDQTSSVRQTHAQILDEVSRLLSADGEVDTVTMVCYNGTLLKRTDLKASQIKKLFRQVLTIACALCQ